MKLISTLFHFLFLQCYWVTDMILSENDDHERERKRGRRTQIHRMSLHNTLEIKAKHSSQPAVLISLSLRVFCEEHGSLRSCGTMRERLTYIQIRPETPPH